MSRCTSVEIPEGAMVSAEIAIVSFLNEEGQECWSMSFGDTVVSTSHAVGLLEMVKHSMLNSNGSSD